MNDVVNRLNKTKEQRKPDLQAEREERDRQDRVEKKRLEEQKVSKMSERGGICSSKQN